MASLRHTSRHPHAWTGASTEPIAAESFGVEDFRVESFDYLRTGRSPQLLGLAVRTPAGLPDTARLELIVERATFEHVFAPQRASVRPIPGDDSGAWLWRGVFAVPSEMSLDPGSVFTVQMLDRLILALPAPSDRRAIRRHDAAVTSVRAWPYTVRRGMLAAVLTCQLAVMPGWLAGGALADERTGAQESVETVAEPPTGPSAEEPEAEPQPEEVAPQPPNETAPQPPTEPSPPAPETDPKGPQAPPQGEPVPTPPAQSSAGAGVQTSEPQPTSPTQPQGAGAAGGPGGPTTSSASRPPAQREKASTKIGHANSPHAPRQDADAHKGSAAHKAPSDSAAISPEYPEVPVFEGLPAGLTNIEANQPPPYLIPIYEAAGRRYHVPWRVLAAINEIESNYGQNMSTSSAGALGWMQFMPATWQEWGVDADHDGYANPYSPQDAIFAAARYLDASGASRDLPGAIFAYNHADWYVAEVLMRARLLGDAASFAQVEQGYALPLDQRYMKQLGRTDDGVDIETPPDGALVYSITPGVVSAVASDPAGFGPSYPVVEATAGALTGQHIYYGHVAQSLVQAGERVAAGQPIAIVGHTGDAASLGHGHIEIGFSDAGGAPLNQHGAEAWTPAGSVMRAFLVGLSASFGIHSS